LRALAQQAPEAVCQAEGHVKLTRAYNKFYRSVLRYVGAPRWSKRAFQRAEEAEIYGRKLSARVCRMAAISKAATEVATTMDTMDTLEPTG
jgi:hypothetical protein